MFTICIIHSSDIFFFALSFESFTRQSVCLKEICSCKLRRIYFLLLYHKTHRLLNVGNKYFSIGFFFLHILVSFAKLSFKFPVKNMSICLLLYEKSDLTISLISINVYPVKPSTCITYIIGLFVVRCNKSNYEKLYYNSTFFLLIFQFEIHVIETYLCLKC